MPRHLLFVFLDGVGLGGTDPAVNPFARLPLPGFARLAGGARWTHEAPTLERPTHVFQPLDATLGVPGLPQSGTGQATLLTGVNCAARAGRHYGPFPHTTSRPLLAANNLFHQVQRLGLPFEEPAAFANAYPDRFFTYVERSDRWTVTTRCCLDAGVRIRTHADLVQGDALAADVTAGGWPQRDPHLEPLTEAEAAHRLAGLTRRHAFTLFEHFHTDKAGHSRSFDRAEAVLTSLDRFFDALLDALDPAHTLLLVTSDHGNIEDLSTKSHTAHPVPLAALGDGAHHFAATHDLTGVAPAIVAALEDGRAR